MKFSERQAYLNEMFNKTFDCDKHLSFELNDIIEEMLNKIDKREVTYIYNQRSFKMYIIDKARAEAHKPGTFGWDGENVLEMLELIDELSKEG